MILLITQLISAHFLSYKCQHSFLRYSFKYVSALNKVTLYIFLMSFINSIQKYIKTFSQGVSESVLRVLYQENSFHNVRIVISQVRLELFR